MSAERSKKWCLKASIRRAIRGLLVVSVWIIKYIYFNHEHLNKSGHSSKNSVSKVIEGPF